MWHLDYHYVYNNNDERLAKKISDKFVINFIKDVSHQRSVKLDLKTNF